MTIHPAIVELTSSALFDASGSLLPAASRADVDIFLPATHLDQARQTAATLVARAGVPCRVWLVLDDARQGFVAVCNRLMQVSKAPFVAYVAQDAFPGRQWLALGLSVLQGQQLGLLAFNDGKWFGQLAAFGLVRRQWVQTVYGGDLFCPGYGGHYADTELTLIAKSQGQLAFNANALLIEVDHHKDGKATSVTDKALFAQRKQTGFEQRVSDPALLAQFS